MTDLEYMICEAESIGEIDLDTRDKMLDILYEKKTLAEYRKQKFLKQHDYNTKDKTIKMGNERMKFKYLDGSKKHNDYLKASITKPNKDNIQTIKMNRAAFNTKNPNSHEYIVNHEYGHRAVKYYRDDDWGKDADIDDAVNKGFTKHKVKSNSMYKHGSNKDEYLADYYSVNHTKNGIKAMKDTSKSISKNNRKVSSNKLPLKKINELHDRGITKPDKMRKANRQLTDNEFRNREKIVKDMHKNKDLDFLKE